MYNLFLKTWDLASSLAVQEYGAGGRGSFLVERDVPAPASVSPEQVTPGTLGFIVTFAIGVAVIIIGFCVTRSIRKVRYRIRREEPDYESHPPVPTGGI